jgi:hypothetical protein
MVAGVAFVAVVVGVLLFLYGPDSLATTPPPLPRPAPLSVQVPFREIARGSQSTEARRVNYAITSTADLAKLWKMLDATSMPPKVDFTTNTVVATFAGKESTSGYSIAVSKVEDTKVRMVTVKITKPGSNCLLAQVLTAPYQIIEIPKTSLPLGHSDVVTTRNCSK